jgi:hypothetical protein
VNIDGFGHRFEPAIDFEAEDAERRVADAIFLERVAAQERGELAEGVPLQPTDDEVAARKQELVHLARIERARLQSFFDFCCFDHSFVDLRRRTRQDLETTGNAYWEVLRDGRGQLARLVYVPSHTVRLMPLDAQPIEVAPTFDASCTEHVRRVVVDFAQQKRADDVPVGVILYSLPRLSVPLDGVQPMNILELARIWISPDVQGVQTKGSDGKMHSFSVATCAVGRSLRAVRQDWFSKYPHMPNIHAVVSWADTVHHEGTIYRASNFVESGTSGGSMHGNRVRKNGGRDQWNSDYAHVKTRFLYRFDNPLSDKEKERIKKKLPADRQKTFLS